MSTLFDITTEQKKLIEAVKNDEFTLEDAKDTLESFELEFNDKINNCCHANRLLNSEYKAIDDEINRLQTLKKQKGNQIKRLKDIMLTGMRIADLSKFDTGLFKGHTRKGSFSIKITSEKDIPDEYVSTEVKYSPDKALLKKAIQEGKEIEGCELVQGETSLVIK